MAFLADFLAGRFAFLAFLTFLADFLPAFFAAFFLAAFFLVAFFTAGLADLVVATVRPP